MAGIKQVLPDPIALEPILRIQIYSKGQILFSEQTPYTLFVLRYKSPRLKSVGEVNISPRQIRYQMLSFEDTFSTVPFETLLCTGMMISFLLFGFSSRHQM